MRLPMIQAEEGLEVDYDQFNQMIDAYLGAGFNYFDTAHGYIDGKSEIALRECLVKRVPRESFFLVNKLTTHFFQKESEIRPFFEQQLLDTGVDYFDTYLMHALNAEFYEKYVSCHAFEIAKQLKAEGKIKHLGISFHDKADVLEKILREQPDIEMVQIQFNYADYDDAGIESYRCYQICEKYNKPVIVMEPVKGGGLVNLPEEAQKVIDAQNEHSPNAKHSTNAKHASNASYAIRFCASFENVTMVLSGMSTLAQMEDNLSYMKAFVPFSEEEYQMVDQIREILKKQDTIRCTGCQYCVVECPMAIAIPALFADFNAKKQFDDWNSDWYYGVHTKGKGKASDCIKCGKCETVCPQYLKIRDHLDEVSVLFDK